MCLGAAWWARCSAVVYGNGRAEAAAIGFDDDAIHAEVARPVQARVLPLRQLMATEALEALTAWAAQADRAPY